MKPLTTRQLVTFTTIVLLLFPSATGRCSSSASTALSSLSSLENKLEKISILMAAEESDSDSPAASLKEDLADFKADMKNFTDGISTYSTLQTKLSALKKLETLSTSKKNTLVGDITEAIEGLSALKALNALL